MKNQSISAVILAAGKGTRMKSGKAKVLHELFFKPMLHHVLDSVIQTKIEQIAVVVGHQRQRVLDSIIEYCFTPVWQEEQLGTGHAVLCAETACQSADQVMILCGDTPLIRPNTLQAMIRQHNNSQSKVTLMTTLLDDPFGYGRIISDDDDNILEIVEQKDADTEQLTIQEINAGIYIADADFLFSTLKEVGTDNSQGEIYLTDIISIAVSQGLKVSKFTHSPSIDILGVNSRVELAQAHLELQQRRNREIMLGGVSLCLPMTTLIDPDSTIGHDSIIQAGVQIRHKSIIGASVRVGPGAVISGCRLGDHCVIGANSVLENCIIETEEHVPPLTYRTG
jgi:bifunctional UDP-N-acetylglucosamine pyrophosphorylase/glucosamine-1-phosphate N-acetyltransferase